jgi:hypothetical protein
LIANDKLYVRQADATGEIGAFQEGKTKFLQWGTLFRPIFKLHPAFFGAVKVRIP